LCVQQGALKLIQPEGVSFLLPGKYCVMSIICYSITEFVSKNNGYRY
jgi:hypothetical protein